MYHMALLVFALKEGSCRISGQVFVVVVVVVVVAQARCKKKDNSPSMCLHSHLGSRCATVLHTCLSLHLRLHMRLHRSRELAQTHQFRFRWNFISLTCIQTRTARIFSLIKLLLK